MTASLPHDSPSGTAQSSSAQYQPIIQRATEDRNSTQYVSSDPKRTNLFQSLPGNPGASSVGTSFEKQELTNTPVISDGLCPQVSFTLGDLREAQNNGDLLHVPKIATNKEKRHRDDTWTVPNPYLGHGGTNATPWGDVARQQYGPSPNPLFQSYGTSTTSPHNQKRPATKGGGEDEGTKAKKQRQERNEKDPFGPNGDDEDDAIPSRPSTLPQLPTELIFIRCTAHETNSYAFEVPMRELP
ncbi:hypothetical protein B0T10DRAFT_464616 [Thelonectria olida]|uniref:Uncharacterized protein n=1 Tax=Thelonectria olida TaxID=1576542 RepID=A0A9P8VV09_9HYPO|nr:hypothetical protein B0T10DRAFT_464616 [Thelonectria olida]